MRPGGRHEWIDPRHAQVHAFGAPTPEEQSRPAAWRYWRALPAKGRAAIFFNGWYADALDATDVDDNARERRLADISRFERMLADEGVLLLKFWFHLTERQQKRRLKDLSDDPRTAWRVTDAERAWHERYDAHVRVAEQVIRRTSTGEAPWVVIPGADARYRAAAFGRALQAALAERLDRATHLPVDRTPALPPPMDGLNVIRALTLRQPLDKADYEEQLDEWQGRLAALSRHKRFAKTSVVAVFEGPDAAGKGGAIRRVTHALDARLYRVIPIAAPTEEERAQPYLWRFWRHLPARGHLALYDRSWYGRVLVERVERYCDEADWMRAYAEIVDFENQLLEHDTVIVKFWLQISAEEQLARFQEREKTPWKQFKITPEDWRNRDKWDAYERAVCDMIERTSTEGAPWTLVESDNKYFARIKVLKTLVRALEQRLGDAGVKPKRR